MDWEAAKKEAKVLMCCLVFFVGLEFTLIGVFAVFLTPSEKLARAIGILLSGLALCGLMVFLTVKAVKKARAAKGQ